MSATDLASQVAQLRADLERHRRDPKVMWVTRTGRVRHLLHDAHIGHPGPIKARTSCYIELAGLAPAEADDTRSVCRKCENERRERHNWKVVQAEREAEEREAWAAREEKKREAREADKAEFDTTIEILEAAADLKQERNRRWRLLKGEQERAPMTPEEMRERTDELRVENDRLESEMIAAAS